MNQGLDGRRVPGRNQQSIVFMFQSRFHESQIALRKTLIGRHVELDMRIEPACGLFNSLA